MNEIQFNNKNKNDDNKSGFGGKPKFERNDRNSFGNNANGGKRQARDGDWDCPKCHMNNFAFRTACKRCNSGKDGNQHGGKPGDWICSQCSKDNFAFRTECKRCNAPKGDSEVVPGERGGNACGGFGGGPRISSRRSVENKSFGDGESNNKKMIDLVYCPTDVNIADMLTKPPRAVKLNKLGLKANVK